METNGQANGLKSRKKENGDGKDNLWSAILEEVQNQGNTKLPSNKNVLVLGDNETGKTTLIAKLQGVEDPKKGSALEYAYIDVRDEYRDDHTRLSVWVLDGDPGHTNLLKFALNEETFPHTLVIFTVAMTTPWGILDQLQSWASALGDHIDKLNFTPEQRLESKKAQTQKWLRYTEPGDELEPATSPMKRSSRNLADELAHDDDDDAPLPEAVLTTNLGLDIVVVVTKTDYMTTLEKEHDYRDEHFDFMQQWIRRFCLQYGAALFYTSAKEDKNCDLLYKYLTHRIYGLPFRTPALIVEKDAVLIPAGWDSMKKISILYENMQSCKPDDYYRDIIVQPATRKSGGLREAEVCAEDEQAFLQRQLAALQAGAPAPRADSPLRAAQRTAAQLDGTKISMGGGSPGNEGVLASFFNSLLYKKTGSPAPRVRLLAARHQANEYKLSLRRLPRALLAHRVNKSFNLSLYIAGLYFVVNASVYSRVVIYCTHLYIRLCNVLLGTCARVICTRAFDILRRGVACNW